MGKPRVYVHRCGDMYGLYMDGENEASLGEFAEVADFGRVETPAAPEQLVEEMSGADALLSLNGMHADEITTGVLRAVGTVKVAVISHFWHGCHHVDWWEAAGVKVIDRSEANSDAVAEWALGCIIMGVRRLVRFNGLLKAGSPWGEPRRDAGIVCESVVGLVGLGRIGRVLARHLVGLGADVIAYDAYVSEDEAVALGVRLVPLEELMRTADVISLHLPVTDQTVGIIGRRELGLIKDGAVLVNSARALLLDWEALMDELRTGRFQAFMDVYQVEPLPLDDPLRPMDNVFITPHVAGDSAAMFRRCGRLAIEALREHFQGKAQ